MISSFINAKRSGLPYNKTMRILGRAYVIVPRFPQRLFLHNPGGVIVIGDNFTCNNMFTSNSVGLIQPCLFNIYGRDSKIIIGNNVGISGSTINATTTITIGDNTIIGSGCLITDTDSHPIVAELRNGLTWVDHVEKAPIVIGNSVFIGARCIILKGVTIGEGAVIGAGSVVTKDVPAHSVVAGNPAKIIRYLG